MLRTVPRRLSINTHQIRSVTGTATQTQTKREGDISDSFVSLSGAARPLLPQRFLNLKKTLVSGHEGRVIDSWNRLLAELKRENKIIARGGPGIIPSLDFQDLDTDITKLRDELEKRGVAVIRGVLPEDEARSFKDEIEEYVRQNPQTKAFPPHDPQVYELYWSAPQLRARAHPNMLKVQAALMKLWRTSNPESPISILQPLSYADRLRIRQPGDANFALGPHIDGGSVERWELNGYGRGGVYNKVFEGSWEEYDPWDASTRVSAVANNYNGLGACSMFRMFQGWLSMSITQPFEGTLMVNPAIKLSTAYLLLRPFFRPIKDLDQASPESYLAAETWEYAGAGMTSELHGATPGHGQELDNTLHPHLDLENTMVHVPRIKPGDYVVWHCDSIHAVDKVHEGNSDSSVLYIPVCPLTEVNARYLARQKNAFLNGTPGPDFPGGPGEADHVNRQTESHLRSYAATDGLRAFGFEKLDPATADTSGAKTVTSLANEILGF
ncbi:DUF1479-domain-containing protein [Daldinia decipiens]|uniref:DUF1479-domain-containing protein n=1 Tax=Daldinia decipiens TaxID=326647 RepID=UPI0020C4219D|nr:DUF1479-domain-containing protein [Daldinia decipiens]KAI1661850.1 DUF1479-domain-containing protein [Daldinia decipiens]